MLSAHFSLTCKIDFTVHAMIVVQSEDSNSGWMAG